VEFLYNFLSVKYVGQICTSRELETEGVIRLTGGRSPLTTADGVTVNRSTGATARTVLNI
jgi:hypothetical protein